MERMQKQAEKFGARVQFGTFESLEARNSAFRLTVDGEAVETRTVIIATGVFG